MRFIYTKAFGIFFACLALVAILVFLQTRGLLDPVRKAALSAPKPVAAVISGVVSPIKFFFVTAYQLHKIVDENTELRIKVANLEQNLVQYNQQIRENEALRNELGFVKYSKLQLIACTTLSRDAFVLSDSLILNCGSADGVQEGQAVISQGYLVGKITYAGKTTSNALLAVSSKFSTDARLSQTNATALAVGSFGSGLILDQLAQTQNLQKGWQVVTAGINQRIPKNLLIGEVGDMLSSGSDLFKRASVVSPIDFDNLEFVFVVK